MVEEYGEGILLKPKLQAMIRNWDELIGCVPYKGPRKSIREMDQAVMAEARERRGQPPVRMFSFASPI